MNQVQKKDKLVAIFLVFISLVAHWRWITNLSVLSWGDWVFQNIDTLKQLFAIPTIWISSAFGDINIGISFTPFQLLYGLLAHLGIGFAIGERIVFLWPIMILLPLGSYFLIRKNVPGILSAVIGSLVYTYNTYFAEIQTGHLTLLTAYAFTPFLLLSFQKTLETKKIFYALLSGLLGFIISFYEFRAFYIVCFILFFYYLYYVFTIEKVKSLRMYIKISLFAGLPIFLVFLLNAYWLLALSKAGSLTSNAYFERSLFGNEFLNINYAFSFFHPFWTGGRTTEFIAKPIFFFSWLIPLCAFLGMLFQRKNKTILFFGFIALLGIFLTKQVGQPFSVVYPWLYNHFPGFNAFREASKFYFLIAIGYSMLVAGFINWISDIQNKKFLVTPIKYSISILVAAVFLWNAKPMLTGEIATLFIPRTPSNDYMIVNEFINQDSHFSRTLWFPTFSRWGLYTDLHPEVSAVNQLDGIWNIFIKQERNIIDRKGIVEKFRYTEADLTVILLGKKYGNNLLDNSSIKYILVPVEDTVNDDNFFKYYGKDKQFYTSSIDKIPYLKRIDIGTKDIAIYENKNIRPHLYLTNTKESIEKTIPYQAISFQMINPSEYNVILKNIKGNTYLNFAESYHPKWDLRVGKFSWLGALTQKNYFLPDSYHFMNDAYLNSYLINPDIICHKYPCKENKDGSYDIEMTLYFSPQSYIYLGMLVSIITILTGGLSLVILFLRKGGKSDR